MDATRRRLLTAGVAGAVLTAIAAAVVARASTTHTAWPVIVAAVSVGLPFAVAIVVTARYPDRALGWLLVLIGVAYFARAMTASPDPAVYSVARATGQLAEPLLLWLILAFPSGRLQTRTARALVAAGWAAVVLLWWPVVALSPDIPTAGPQIACGDDCPRNVLLVADAPGVEQVFEVAFRLVGGGLLFAAAGYLAWRLRGTTALSRKILAPVVVASIARSIAAGLFVALGDPDWIRAFLVLTYWAILVAIGVGLARVRAYDAAALQRLVAGLRTRPGPDELRAVMADALGDPELEIAYWLPDARSYAGADGRPVATPREDERHAVAVIADERDTPTAALVYDRALLDHPGLVDALTASAALALETNRTEAEAAAARAGTIAAVDSERRRIERDLHDGAQQRLIALRMKVAVAERLLDRDEARTRELLRELGGDVDEALIEVRALAHGIAPPALVELGLGEALAELARDAPIDVRVRAERIARPPPDVETQVYFCVREALQNAVKHAGENATVVIEVADQDGLCFAVTDDGSGFDPAGTPRGAGMENMRERLAAIGGTVEIRSSPGGGTTVSGRV